MADLAILVPMLHRAHRVEPLLASITATTPGARVLFLTTPEDLDVRDAIAHAGADHLDVAWHDHGDFARKINAGYRSTTEPLLFLGADDLHFHPGWYQAATARLNGKVGVVGTNDLGNPRVLAGLHATHSLVTRDYVDRFGTIDEHGKVLHEGYTHEFVDDELVGTAKKRRAWAFAGDSHVEHLHPHWAKAPTDELYEAQGERLAASRGLYNQRRRLWR